MKQEQTFADEIDDCATDAALYALGALPPEKTHQFELRLRSGCQFCASQVEHYALVAEEFALAAAPVQPRPELRQRLLDRIRTQDEAAQTTPGRKVIRGKDQPWTKMPIAGIEMRPLIGEKTFMVRMQPGTVFPKHDHALAEQCYVLEGSITDADGLTLHAGDFVVMPRDTEHDPIHSATGCTLFIVYAD